MSKYGDKVREVEIIARGYFQDASSCHDFTHVERVRVLAKRIARKEGADEFVVELASLLHDIGRAKEMQSKGQICHAQWGEKEAKKILERMQIEEKIIENVCHSIVMHRHRNQHVPQTIEAKCLYDADKLDSIGAVGIARDFVFAGYIGASVPKPLYTGREKELARTGKDYSYTIEDSALLEYEVKLKHLYKKMMTTEGKKMARERHTYMKEFFTRFWKETKGLL